MIPGKGWQGRLEQQDAGREEVGPGATGPEMAALAKCVKGRWPSEVFLGLLELQPGEVGPQDLALALCAVASQLEVVASEADDRDRSKRKQLLAAKLSNVGRV